MQRRGLVVFVYLSLLASSIGCFYLALHYFDAGLMFMAIGSSNPHPTGGIEYVRATNEGLMWKAKMWFGFGLVFLGGIIVSLIVNRRGRKRDSN
jgi:hypothetical protein